MNFFLPGSRTYVLMRASGEAIDPDYRYFYSNLAAWGYNDSILRGATAFGIPAPFGSGPTGTVVRYIGLFEGRTDEQYDFEDERPYGSVSFAITMTFDPATGSARFQGRPIVSLLETHLLEPLLLDDIEWTAGYHAFYRPVPGEPDNKNYPLSGQFAGPAADELIGGLRFSYVSPLDGTTQEARGAFIAKR
ncbi:hypothetical protein EKN06_13990 [Croceicoccus ponticola]|uniref:Transferrin-binding protein B C-lobe/N-lobe beta barrel domain-containing protein n=1 Tax=Croceicoccus ponticola TaxID=2217664 RepID=A0A437GUH1_9SPHN|nr:hypothetical protein EKN06_13990 [Croceicoccus ponticola]